MLEIRNLVKTYATKGGVVVRALDDVSVCFPQTGMVFLLGRSGSGKSTLLNVSGGLDKPDSGEIIVKGRSSKNFSESDFDSYRNTFVGFIFQEYNILNEFTVEQNIALALQLQNKPNDKKAVEALLEQVDLKGLGKRKPNTLSGGQKQRVAIARALIKEPEIIMADEPTGALDSNTGKQVFDTLKKLSKTKLVVVVSHDREFAKHYGDRIIELSDGKIISDLSKDKAKPEKISDNVQKISEDTISIKNTEEITEEEVKSILTLLKKNKGEAIITSGRETLGEIKKVCKVDEDGNREYFKTTEKIESPQYDGKKTKFIKSRLPARHAIKMGASGLKTKPIRLIFTILLSVVAFAMFGIASTLMLYDSAYSISNALKETNNPSFTLAKKYEYTIQSIKINNATGETQIDHEYENTQDTYFGVQETVDKSVNGLDFAGIFNFSGGYNYAGNSRVDIKYWKGNYFKDFESESYYYPVKNLLGFSDCGESYLTRNGYREVAGGRYPTTLEEIAISKYLAEILLADESLGFNSLSDILGNKVAIVNNQAVPEKVKFTIVGIYDTGVIDAKYDVLKDEDANISLIEKQTLASSLSDYLSYSLHTVAFVSDGFYQEYKQNIVESYGGVWIPSTSYRGLAIEQYPVSYELGDYYDNALSDTLVNGYKEMFSFYDLEGNEIDFSINDDEIFLSKTLFDSPYLLRLESMVFETVNNANLHAEAKELLSNTDDIHQLIWQNKLDEIEEIINDWYAILAYRSFVIEGANYLLNQIAWIENRPVGFENFQTLLERANDSRWNTDAEPLSEEEWTELISFFETNSKIYAPGILTARYFYQLMLKVTEGSDNKEYFEENFGTSDYYSLYHNLLSNSMSEEEYELLLPVLEREYKKHVSEEMKELKETFEPDFSFEKIERYYFKNYAGSSGELTVKGYYTTTAENDVRFLVSKNFLNRYSSEVIEEEYSWRNNEVSNYTQPEDARYNYLYTQTTNSQEEIQSALSTSGLVSYYIKGSTYESIVIFLNLITSMKQIFLIAGIVFGVFAGLMLVNFISVSISAKKKDIGILRAVGARGTDVFKIFFSEASIIAVICFILATVASYIVCGVLNTSFGDIVNMTLLDFGVINVLLILVISFAVSLFATFFPVYIASKKSPVESIRAL